MLVHVLSWLNTWEQKNLILFQRSLNCQNIAEKGQKGELKIPVRTECVKCDDCPAESFRECCLGTSFSIFILKKGYCLPAPTQLRGGYCPLHHSFILVRARGEAPVMPHWSTSHIPFKTWLWFSFWEFQAAKDYGENKEHFSLPARKFPAIWHIFNTWIPSVARIQHRRRDRQTVLLFFWFMLENSVRDRTIQVLSEVFFVTLCCGKWERSCCLPSKWQDTAPRQCWTRNQLVSCSTRGKKCCLGDMTALTKRKQMVTRQDRTPIQLTATSAHTQQFLWLHWFVSQQKAECGWHGVSPQSQNWPCRGSQNPWALEQTIITSFE